MSKKLITAALALVALAAFALPASASASPELTQPTGTRVPVEPSPGVKTKITGTNIGNTLLKDDSGETTLTTCSSAIMTGELVKNTGTLIEGNITTATFSGTGGSSNGMNECTGFDNLTVTTNGGGVDGENVANGTPWCLKTISATEFQVAGGLCGGEAREITFIFDTTFSGECKYKRTTAIKGTYTTDATGDAILTVLPNANSTFVKEGGGILCPEKGTLEMKFTLEKDEATTTPMYIS